MSLYLIGWDVGSWKCSGDSKDAVCVLHWDGTSISQPGKIYAGNLFDGRPPQLSTVIDVTHIHPPSEAKIILAIDAVFGWPTRFGKLLCGDASYTPCCTDRNTQNRYLYRETERFLDNTLSMGSNPPMTAVGGAIGSAGTKAQWFISNLRSTSDCYVPPFDTWKRDAAAAATCTVIEVYPAAANKSRAFADLKVRSRLTPGLPDKGDAADALRAAMVAACYAQTVGVLNNALPTVYLPDDPETLNLDANAIRTEGWIFSPRR